MKKILLDRSMQGLEGQPRIYREICPSILARIYKEPHWILEVTYENARQDTDVRKL